jgi:chromate transport protein ChrA
MNTTSLVFGVLYGSIGFGYLIYGRRQRKGIALLSAVALCAFPYFISNIVLLILIGLVFIALPFYIRY